VDFLTAEKSAPDRPPLAWAAAVRRRVASLGLVLGRLLIIITLDALKTDTQNCGHSRTCITR
jgi:hypothetical protein